MEALRCPPRLDCACPQRDCSPLPFVATRAGNMLEWPPCCDTGNIICRTLMGWMSVARSKASLLLPRASSRDAGVCCAVIATGGSIPVVPLPAVTFLLTPGQIVARLESTQCVLDRERCLFGCSGAAAYSCPCLLPSRGWGTLPLAWNGVAATGCSCPRCGRIVLGFTPLFWEPTGMSRRRLADDLAAVDPPTQSTIVRAWTGIARFNSTQSGLECKRCRTGDVDRNGSHCRLPPPSVPSLPKITFPLILKCFGFVFPGNSFENLPHSWSCSSS